MHDGSFLTFWNSSLQLSRNGKPKNLKKSGEKAMMKIPRNKSHYLAKRNEIESWSHFLQELQFSLSKKSSFHDDV